MASIVIHAFKQSHRVDAEDHAEWGDIDRIIYRRWLKALETFHHASASIPSLTLEP